MSQIQVTGEAKIRTLTGALTATAGVVTSVPLGDANGVATLGADGKVPSAQLPTLGSSYKGTWNAATNTPYIVDGVGTAGDYYLVSTGGTWNGIVFVAGNTVIYSGSIWQRAGGGTGTVTSVGLSAPAAFSITGSPITGAGTLAIAGAGTANDYIKGDGTLGVFSSAAVASITGGASTIATSNLDTSKALNSNSSGKVVANITTATELSYLSGVTSNVQTQLDGKGPSYTLGSVSSSPTSVLVITGTGAPVNGTLTFTINKSSTTQNGYLASADFTTFNNKQNAITLTTTGSSGAATLVGSTLNIPNYSINTTDFVTIGTTQTITGTKTFDGAIRNESGLLLKNGVLSGLAGYTSLAGASNGLIVQLSGSSNQQTLIFQSAAAYSYTLPASSGTIALTSNISYPVTSVFGRTGVIVAASGDYTTTQVTEGTNLYFTNARSRGAISLTTTGSSGAATYNSTTGVLNVPQYSTDLSGYVTIGTTQTITGNKTFNEATRQESGLLLKNGALAGATGYTSLAGSASNGLSIQLSGSSNQQNLIFQSAASYSYTFPTASGTLALTSQLTSGTVTSVGLSSSTSGVSISSTPVTTSGTIILNIATASGSQNGLLSSADWNTFNNAATGSFLPLSGGTLSGNLIVNGSTNTPLKITATEPYMEIQSNGSTNVCGIKFLPSTGYDAYVGNYGSGKLWLIAGNADNAYVDTNGDLFNRTGVYGTISDITLKENIVDATPKLDDLLKLKVRNFNFIGNDKKQLGFIAQEFEDVFPNAISIDNGYGDNNGKKVVKTTVLIPMLVKAIQELKAEIDELKRNNG